MNKIKVLLIEDDRSISNFITATMDREGYKIMRALNGREGLSLSTSFCPNVILLDLGLPDMDGLEVLQKLRSWSDVPVIIISARTKEQEKVSALDLGADDYITKPYALAIVKVHIEAILKRAGKQKERVEVGHIAVEPDTWRVYVDEKAIETTPKEYELLSYLIKNKNVVMTRDSILESVWGYDYSGDTRTVDTLVKQLRRKIAPYGSYIRSVYGVGYIFEGEENETAEA